MTVLMQINSLANRCNFFYNANFDPEAIVCPNNGYNCRHKDCQEQQDGIGYCMASACPLAYEADEKDCDDAGVEYEEGEFMVVEIPDDEFDPNIMWPKIQE